MLELIIAVLQIYVGSSIIIAVLSYVLHYVPVHLALKQSVPNGFIASNFTIMSLAYLITVFLAAPKILFSFLNNGGFRTGLYNFLKDQ